MFRHARGKQRAIKLIALARKCVFLLLVGVLFGGALLFLFDSIRVQVDDERAHNNETDDDDFMKNDTIGERKTTTTALKNVSVEGVVSTFFANSTLKTSKTNVLKNKSATVNATTKPIEPSAHGIQAAKPNYYFGEKSQTLAGELSRRVRIFSWIATMPESYVSKALHVARTWAQRCNTFVFVSSLDDPSLPAIDLMSKHNLTENRNNLWAKKIFGFQYAYEHHLQEHDWFLKADDDTYVVVENLRYMLLPHDPDEPLHFGFRYNKIAKDGYMSGGAGYVLSRAAVKKFVEGVALNDTSLCKVRDLTGAEDAEMGICLGNFGVRAGDTRDAKGRHRMLPLSPRDHLNPDQVKDPNFWFWANTYHPFEPGPECCSDNVVSFHYVEPYFMYVLDYFTYRVSAFGANVRLLSAAGNETDAVVANAKRMAASEIPKTPIVATTTTKKQQTQSSLSSYGSKYEKYASTGSTS